MAGTWVPVSVVLDCTGDGMPVEEILTEDPTLRSGASVPAAAHCAALARETLLPMSS